MAINGPSTRREHPASAATLGGVVASRSASAAGWSPPARAAACRSPMMPRSKAVMSWVFWLTPPRLWKIAIERGGCRPPDGFPTRHPLRRKMKQRDHIEAGDQHPIECTYRSNKIFAIFRLEQRGDHRVHRGTLDPHIVTGAGLT